MVRKTPKKLLSNNDATVDDGTDICCGIFIFLFIGLIILAFFVWTFSIHVLVGLGLLLITLYLVDHLLGLGIFESVISTVHETKDNIDWGKKYGNQVHTLECELRNLADGGADVTRVRHNFENFISNQNGNGILEIEKGIEEKKSNQKRIKMTWQSFQEVQKEISQSELLPYIEEDLQEVKKALNTSKKTLESNDVDVLIERINQIKKKYKELQDIKNDGFKF